MADKSWLDITHPSYAEAAPHWAFCRQSYEGGPDYFRPNLIKFRLEYDSDFEDRLKKACRYNFTAQSVNLVSGHLLKVAPTRKADQAPEGVKRFWGKATKDGDNIDTFAKELADWSSVYGRLYVVVDVPSDDGQAPATEQERRERGLEPYAYWVAPEDVLDLARDKDGELLWIKIRERFRDDADPKKAAESIEDRYRLWERGKWSLWRKIKDKQGNETAELVAGGEVSFGKVPVIVLEHKDGGDYTSPGLVDDLVYLDRSIFNLMSEMDETISCQTFSQLTIPSDAVGTDAGDDTYIAMGKRRIFTYKAEAKNPPGYISPDASQGGLILQTIDQRCHQAHDSVNLGDEVGGNTAQGSSSATSGVTMAYRFAKLESGLATKAGEAEEAEYKMACLADLWTGGDGKLPEGIVSYSRRFDVVALQQALQDALSVEAVLAGSSPTALALLRKQVVAKALDRVDPADLETVNEEIDAFAAIEKMEPLTEEDDEGESDDAARGSDQMMDQSDG